MCLTIQSHHYGSYFHINDINVTRLMQAVPMLTEIKWFVSMRSVSVDDVLRFVLNFKLLNTFHLYVGPFDGSLQDKLQTRLGIEWQICIHRYNLLTLERCRPKIMEIENNL